MVVGELVSEVAVDQNAQCGNQVMAWSSLDSKM